MSREAIVGGLLGIVGAGCSIHMTAYQAQPAGPVPISVSPRVSAISEAGDTAFFTVALPSRPHGPVRIDITIDHASEAQAIPSSLTFWPNDWAARTIQIVAV